MRWQLVFWVLIIGLTCSLIMADGDSQRDRDLAMIEAIIRQSLVSDYNRPGVVDVTDNPNAFPIETTDIINTEQTWTDGEWTLTDEYNSAIYEFIH